MQPSSWGRKGVHVADKILRHRMSIVIVAIVTSAFCLQSVIWDSRPAYAQTSSRSAYLRFAWGITSLESVRVCMVGSGQAKPSSDEAGLFWFFEEDNAEMLVKEIRLQGSQFHCVDTTYSELVGAGAVPESTGRVQFALAVPALESHTAAVQTIDTITGSTLTQEILGLPEIAGNFRDTAE